MAKFIVYSHFSNEVELVHRILTNSSSFRDTTIHVFQENSAPDDDVACSPTDVSSVSVSTSISSYNTIMTYAVTHLQRQVAFLRIPAPQLRIIG